MTKSSPRIDRAIVRLGETIGLSRQTAKQLVKARRVAAHPGEFLRRKRLAAGLGGSGRVSLVPRDVGFAPFVADAIPGARSAVAACQTVLAAWEAATPAPERMKKPFFFNILHAPELVAHPQILDFVTSTAMVEIAAGYLRQIPRLHSLGVFVSPANESEASSQLFHLDGQDARQLKVFINLDRVEPENGPFTFMPIAATRRVMRGIAGGRRTALSDEEVMRNCAPADLIALKGDAGTGAFVDTSRCLHFGSRTRQGRRAVLMINYVPCPDAHVDKVKEGAGYGLMEFPIPPGLDPIRALLLAGRL